MSFSGVSDYQTVYTPMDPRMSSIEIEKIPAIRERGLRLLDMAENILACLDGRDILVRLSKAHSSTIISPVSLVGIGRTTKKRFWLFGEERQHIFFCTRTSYAFEDVDRKDRHVIRYHSRLGLVDRIGELGGWGNFLTQNADFMDQLEQSVLHGFTYPAYPIKDVAW